MPAAAASQNDLYGDILPFSVSPDAEMAFGCDPHRKEIFSLRQSRYVGLAETVQKIADEKHATASSPISLLDVGVGSGVTMRYVERLPCAGTVELHGSDLHIRETGLHGADQWASLYEGDITQGLPEIDSDRFDIVVCEQVLEHVHEDDLGLATLYRMIKPGGTLVVGVPIFPPGINLLRKHLVPLIDRLNPWSKARGHVQAFSLASFSKEVAAARFEIIERRGYRVISGGVLKPLENQAWWYRWNRWLGRKMPKFCIETQIVARKPRVSSRVA